MSKDFADDYSLGKWVKHHFTKRNVKASFYICLCIFVAMILIDFLFSLRSERIVLDDVKLSNPSYYEMSDQVVAVESTPSGKKVMTIKRKMDWKESLFRSAFISFFMFFYISICTRKYSEEQS